jgi:hypothetical protein
VGRGQVRRESGKERKEAASRRRSRYKTRAAEREGPTKNHRSTRCALLPPRISPLVRDENPSSFFSFFFFFRPLSRRVLGACFAFASASPRCALGSWTAIRSAGPSSSSPRFFSLFFFSPLLLLCTAARFDSWVALDSHPQSPTVPRLNLFRADLALQCPVPP